MPVEADVPAEYELDGTVFAQQFTVGFGAKVFLSARYLLRNTVTAKVLWREAIVSSCPLRDWGGYYLSSETLAQANLCALDKNTAQMGEAIKKLTF